jgi:outer membrane murein-binding lipoprotein Lpp
MSQKTLIFQRFLIFFVLLSFFLVSGCSKTVKNCEIKPDLERIGESALENKDNLTETELRAMKMSCGF